MTALLGLPAELRTKIWKLAFKSRKIKVGIISCMTNGSPKIFYDIGMYRYSRFVHVVSQVSGFVCKQFWIETSYTFLSTSVFIFDDSKSFRVFALCNKKFIANISMIVINYDISRSTWHNDSMIDWADALTSSILGRFTGLQGVELNLVFRPGYVEMRGMSNFMADVRWKEMKLPIILRSFQQHKLKANLTSVNIKEQEHKSFPPDSTALGNAIIAQLLDHHPRRVFKRGVVGE